MKEMTLMELVFATVGVFLSMAILCCLCCVCMKFSDLRMRSYILDLAKKKGVKIELDQLDKPTCQSPLANENCTIMVPEVGIIL